MYLIYRKTEINSLLMTIEYDYVGIQLSQMRFLELRRYLSVYSRGTSVCTTSNCHMIVCVCTVVVWLCLYCDTRINPVSHHGRYIK